MGYVDPMQLLHAYLQLEESIHHMTHPYGKLAVHIVEVPDYLMYKLLKSYSYVFIGRSR